MIIMMMMTTFVYSRRVGSHARDADWQGTEPTEWIRTRIVAPPSSKPKGYSLVRMPKNSGVHYSRGHSPIVSSSASQDNLRMFSIEAEEKKHAVPFQIVPGHYGAMVSSMRTFSRTKLGLYYFTHTHSDGQGCQIFGYCVGKPWILWVLAKQHGRIL